MSQGREGSALGSLVETIKQDKKVRVERYSDHIRNIPGQKAPQKGMEGARHLSLHGPSRSARGPITWPSPSRTNPATSPWKDLKGKGGVRPLPRPPL